MSEMEDFSNEFRVKVFERLAQIWSCTAEEARAKVKEEIEMLMNSNSSMTYEDAESTVVLGVVNEKDDKQLDYLWFEYKEHKVA